VSLERAVRLRALEDSLAQRERQVLELQRAGESQRAEAARLSGKVDEMLRKETELQEELNELQAVNGELQREVAELREQRIKAGEETRLREELARIKEDHNADKEKREKYIATLER
jgi:peptidoglycan hydrolase CwlO-like protein